MEKEILSIDTTANIETYPLSEEALAVLQYFEQTIIAPQLTDIGPAATLTPMYEGERPPFGLKEYQIQYPPSLVAAYKIACDKYDKEYMKVVNKHKNWPSDYQYAPYTLAFQVDGPAYSDEFLYQAAFMEPAVLAEVINARVFEYENNIAMYGLNARLWPDGTTNQTWQTALEIIRQKTGKKVAVLAGTEEKLDEMLMYEIGASRGQLPSVEVIRSMTGFDAFLGPNDLLEIYQQYEDNYCPYVFIGRTSRPKSWLRDPATRVDEGFLAQPGILKFVRAHALTHNFDNPNLSLSHPAIIMDTKEAMLMTGAAYLITEPGDIYSPEFQQYLTDNGIDMKKIISGNLTLNQKKKLGDLFINFPTNNLLSEKLFFHFIARGVNPDAIANGNKSVRGKPLKLHYGCYGHVTGRVNRASFLNELMEQIRKRGDYILQPEFSNLQIVDSQNQSVSYLAIDRIFFVRDASGDLKPMESCRSLMPVSAPDGQKNNVHEGPHTKCARIIV